MSAFNVAGSGDNTLIEAVLGDQLGIQDYMLCAAAPVLAILKDEAGTEFGRYNFVASALSVAVRAIDPGATRFTTNGRLYLNLGGAVTVTGHVSYNVKKFGTTFSPLSLSPIVWLKADTGTYQDTAGTTPATADTNPIALWRDQSGNSNNVTQATGGNQPTLKLRIQNNRSVIRFDGTDDFLANVVMTAPSIPYTVYIVHASSGTSGSVFNFQRSTGLSPSEGLFRAASSALRLLCQNGAIDTIDATATPSTATAWHIFSYTLRDTGTTFTGQTFSDGVAVTGPTASAGVRDSTVVARNLLLGALLTGATPNAGDIAEILVYPFSVSFADDTNIRAYLKARWGTP